MNEGSKKLSFRIDGRLRVSSNGRYLVSENDDPVFLLADTAWCLPNQLRREDVIDYYETRRRQGFNAVAMVAYWGGVNAYDKPAFAKDSSGRIDPARPIIDGACEDGYWEHLDYCIDQAKANGMYVVLLPVWGVFVAGDWSGENTERIVFDVENGYTYGRWIGARYADRSHILWMIGGDRAAVYGQGKDYRGVFRAIADGVFEETRADDAAKAGSVDTAPLMSYHSRKEHKQSSHWFHHDTWLTFNSIQEWPESQIAAVINDRRLMPPKPTWVFEPRYEAYRPEWKAWQVRYQAYQSVFSGGFGHTYGHERIFGFEPGWKENLAAEGARQMRHLANLMNSLTRNQYLERIPDPKLIVGDPGSAERLYSDRLTATRGERGDYAFIYTANGRSIPVRMDRLEGPTVDAYWYSPRNGRWQTERSTYTRPKPFATHIESGHGAPLHVFEPRARTGDDNDWVLVLYRSKERETFRAEAAGAAGE